SPGAGEQLVGPPAEQERLGALVGLRDERPGPVVALPPRPSAALESARAVIRRTAVSLHHSIDGDLSHGCQLHVRGSLPWRRPLWAASPLLRTPPPRSDTSSRTSLKNFRDACRQRSDTTTVSRRLRSTSSSAASADKLVYQVDREDSDQWWRASNGSGAWATSSVA